MKPANLTPEIPALRELLAPVITPEHLADADGLPLAVVEGWSLATQDERREALIERLGAFLLLEGAIAHVLRELHGLPADADIEAWIESGHAPENVRQEWRERQATHEAKLCDAIMRDAARSSPRRAAVFVLSTMETAE